MPLYEYKCSCKDCNAVIVIAKPVAEWTPTMQCPHCSDEMTNQIQLVAVHDDHPSWLDDNVRTQIQGDDKSAPIETRGEYEKYCKEHNIIVTDKRKRV